MPKKKKVKQKLRLRRLFVDPASKSSGWALFEGKRFLASGTFVAASKDGIAPRLKQVYEWYEDMVVQVDEVHVEDVPRSRTCHIYVHYSIGVILAALAAKAPVFKVDVPVNAWQKFVEWDRENKKDTQGSTEERLQAFKGRAESRDELSAVGMGLWFLSKEEV